MTDQAASIQLATWNVNSLKVRLPHLLQWLETNPVDLLGLQELKLTDDNFPVAELEAAGYGAVFAGQKTYNGVAILYKKATMPEPVDVQVNLPSFPDEQKRVIAATFGDLRFVSAYVVNGSEVGSDKFEYKKAWLDALLKDCEAWLAKYPQLALVGDYNIAPDDRDVHDPKAWGDDSILTSTAERAALRRLLALGLHDSYRLQHEEGGVFSWWDYRAAGFRRNLGLRIDLVLLSDALAARCTAASIDREPRTWERPSDHAPVLVTLDG